MNFLQNSSDSDEKYKIIFCCEGIGYITSKSLPGNGRTIPFISN